MPKVGTLRKLFDRVLKEPDISKKRELEFELLERPSREDRMLDRSTLGRDRTIEERAQFSEDMRRMESEGRFDDLKDMSASELAERMDMLLDRLQLSDQEMNARRAAGEFAEGGEVEGTGLEKLRSGVGSLVDLVDSSGYYDAGARLENMLGRNVDPNLTRERDERGLGLVAQGLASQWFGQHPETGEPVFALDPEHIGNVRPGIVDETLAIPALGGMVGLPVPEFASEAEARQEALQGQIAAGMGNEDPEGLEEHTAESMGVMLGQVPMPGAWINRLKKAGPVGESIISSLGHYAKKAGLAPIEWLSPITDPKASNYAIGAAFGGILGDITDEELSEETGFTKLEDIIEAADSGDEHAEMMLQIMMMESQQQRQPEGVE